MHTLELHNVNSGYNKKTVLYDVNLTIQEPSIYVVLGPNGAGKTTLFRTIAGILEPYSGEVVFDGENVTSSRDVRKRINYLSHYNAIPEEMTVYDALTFYANMQGGSVDEVLALLHLQELRNKKVSDLSQGQKKRVSVAKVFLRERDLYLMDEPTSNLDPGYSKEIRDILLKLSKDKIVLYSTHNLYEASDIGTNLILIKDGTIALAEKISNIKQREYRVGIRTSTSTDISKIVDAKRVEQGYYVLSVSSPEEAGRILKKLIENGVLVTEMRQLENPLQELFETA
ncbi:MAG: ABC transporter ATP-binding protein [Halobacteriota archaeon]